MTTFATAGAADLREHIITLTGCDPVTEPEFGWSESLPCEVCGIADATALVSVDGEAEQRLCHLCLRDALVSGLRTKQAAELCGMIPSSFRAEMTRERKRGRDYRLPAEQWPDGRTPLWDEAALRAWLVSRPGSGRWRGSPTSSPAASPDDKEPPTRRGERRAGGLACEMCQCCRIASMSV